MPVVTEQRDVSIYDAVWRGPGPAIVGGIWQGKELGGTMMYECYQLGTATRIFYPAAYPDSWRPGDAPEWNTRWCDACHRATTWPKSCYPGPPVEWVSYHPHRPQLWKEWPSD